jgi:plastocyanin
MKRSLVILTIAASAVAPAAAAPTTHITIRHQLQHCHTWSVDGKTWKASLSVNVARGGTIVFQNNDVMPHKLVQVSGPKLHLSSAATMHRMSATYTLRFPNAGTYRFRTTAGEDYMKGVTTVGEDNLLRLTVTVA